MFSIANIVVYCEKSRNCWVWKMLGRWKGQSGRTKVRTDSSTCCSGEQPAAVGPSSLRLVVTLLYLVAETTTMIDEQRSTRIQYTTAVNVRWLDRRNLLVTQSHSCNRSGSDHRISKANAPLSYVRTFLHRRFIRLDSNSNAMLYDAYTESWLVGSNGTVLNSVNWIYLLLIDRVSLKSSSG